MSSPPANSSDAALNIEWIDDGRKGTALSPSGETLGFIDKIEGWPLTVLMAGGGATTVFFDSLDDAKRYLIENGTRVVEQRVYGETRRLRIVQAVNFFEPFAEWTGEVPNEFTYFLRFWESGHDLTEGDQVTFKLQNTTHLRSIRHLRGIVAAVEDHKVTIVGNSWTNLP